MTKALTWSIAAAMLSLAGLSIDSYAQAAPGSDVPKPATLKTTDSPSSLRIKMVREAAMSAAMRSGLAKQSEAINKLLDTYGRLLDDAYDFPSLMLANNVVPPVIRKMENVTEQQGDMLRYSSMQFQIVRQAAFATRAPTWRTYLPLPIWNDLGRTHPSLKPANGEEEAAAKAGLEIGWNAGVEQANQMFYKGLTRLQNDWIGMNTYHALLKSGMVTQPIISRHDVAITGDASKMIVDESTYKIEAKPVFNPNLSQWLALIDRSSTSKIFDEINKPSTAEADRIKVTAPTMDDLVKSWSVR
ncbi:type IV secretory system conjugative DNA transfer family protein [Paracidovorax wautersii]|nr:type IV secretory system conjugative DNA transfer family protein [Paracidovorax wautersii]